MGLGRRRAAAWVTPLQDALVLLSLGVYLLMAWREYLSYQRWLEHHSGAREELRLPWLRGFLLAASALLLLRLGFTISDRWWHRLSYFDEFPRYLATVAVVYYLGLEGWRHARARYPRRDLLPSGDAPAHAGSAPPTVPLPEHASAPTALAAVSAAQEKTGTHLARALRPRSMHMAGGASRT